MFSGWPKINLKSSGEHMKIKPVEKKKQLKPIAITGGPSGGKTTLIEALKRELGKEVAVVPEAASILYKGGFPRLKTDVGAFHAQRGIYLIQIELENLIRESYPDRIVVCDRGSLDGVAYWPKDEVHFYEGVGSTKRRELKRYSWVIHLDTAASDSYEHANPIRTESYQEAWELNEKIKHAWKDHPQRIIIKNSHDFLSKMKLSIAIVEAISRGKSLAFIKKTYFKNEAK